MKNIQVIDGAANSQYNIYEVSDEGFYLIFPNGSDLEFIEDFIDRVGEEKAVEILHPAWERPVRKEAVQGIHGTLFYELKHLKERFYPNKRFSDDKYGS